MAEGFEDETATLGDRIAHAREAQGLSQAQLARRLGLRGQTVRNWEEDRSEPRANRLQMLAGFLNVSMVWLMTGTGEGPSQDGPGHLPDEGGLTEALAELRELRIQQSKIADRLGRLEKRLRATLSVD